jgi:hypothetical protein
MISAWGNWIRLQWSKTHDNFYFLSVTVLLFSNCKRTDKVFTHKLKSPMSSFFSSRDSLFETFYKKEFLNAIDTLRFKGKELPVS